MNKISLGPTEGPIGSWMHPVLFRIGDPEVTSCGGLVAISGLVGLCFNERSVGTAYPKTGLTLPSPTSSAERSARSCSGFLSTSAGPYHVSVP